MNGFFTLGERKDRPGIYKRIGNRDQTNVVSARDGIGCAVVSGSWGPLNTAMTIQASDDIKKFIGTGTGHDVLKQMFKGGVQSAVVVRAGTGGTTGTVQLKDTATSPVSVVSFTAKYPGTRSLSVSVKTSLAESTLKEVVLYDGTEKLESRTIEAGDAEVDAVVAAFANSAYVNVTKVAAGNGTLAAVSQAALTGGTDPTVTTEAYSTGFTTAEPEVWDCICVDTNDTAVHTLLSTYIDRIFDGGALPMAALSEPSTVTLDARITKAASYNNEKIVYVLNGWKDADGTVIEGYLAAARIAGMIAAIRSNESLTHREISDAVSLIESMTNGQIIKAIKSGCLVISKSKTGNVVIEKAINTLVEPAKNQDEGWKKVRRVKARFEMMSRIEITLDRFTGQVNNDNDGRAAIIAAGQAVLDAMVGEGKLFTGASFELDESNPPEGDSAWFVITADDIDSFETGYLSFMFRFTADVA